MNAKIINLTKYRNQKNIDRLCEEFPSIDIYRKGFLEGLNIKNEKNLITFIQGLKLGFQIHNKREM